MRKITFTGFLLLLAVLGCTKEEDKVVATVGTEKIRVKDFLMVYRPVIYETEDAEMEAKYKALENIIEEKLLVAEARSRGYDEDTADSAIAQGIEMVKRRSMESALYKKLVLDKSKPSAAEVKEFYRAEGEVLDLRLIQVETEEEANMITQKFASGVPFDTLVAKFGTGRIPSGGNIGQMPLANFYPSPETFQQLSKLEEGNITSPIESDFGGYDIFFLVSRTTKENIPPLSERKEVIETRIQSIRGAELSKKVLDGLFEEAEVEFNQEGLNLLTKPRIELAPEELSVWTIKLGGEITDSIGSMLALYRDDSTPIQAQYLEEAGRYQVQAKVLEKAALKRNLDRDKTVLEAIETYINAQIRNKLYDEEIRSRVEITPEEVKAYYDEHQDEFYVPERRNLAIIRTHSYSNIQQAHSLLLNGKPFEEVAREFSDHSSKDRGGLVGSRREDDKELKYFVEQAFKLSRGQISRPFEVANGFGLVKVIDIQPAFTKDFKSEERRLERRLLREKEEARKQEFLAELREKIAINVNDNLLAKIAKLEPEEEKPDSNKTK